jgi:hypothetical protein
MRDVYIRRLQLAAEKVNMGKDAKAARKK